MAGGVPESAGGGPKIEGGVRIDGGGCLKAGGSETAIGYPGGDTTVPISRARTAALACP